MRLERYFQQYDGFHRHPGNKLCHFAGIPLIVFSLFGLLQCVNVAYPFWLAASLWYVIQDLKLGLAFSLFLLGVTVAARPMPVSLDWALFVLGWVLQAVGHYHFEKRSPAFYKNFEHLLVGPIWIFARLFI